MGLGSFRIRRDPTRLALFRHNAVELVMIPMLLFTAAWFVLRVVPTEWRPGTGRPLLWALYGAALACFTWLTAGAVRRFKEGDRLTFDRAGDRILRSGQPIARLSDVARLLVGERSDWSRGYVYTLAVVLRDGSRIEIERGLVEAPTDLAREIGDFLGVPVEREWLGGRPLLD